MLGVVLLGGITVLFVTGLLSYAAYNPDLSPVNDKTPDKGLLGFYLFAWPTDPHWLYRLTQGVHVTLGIVLVPVLLAKLWSVVPKLFALPPARSLAHALERISLLLLVGGALFEFVDRRPQHPARLRLPRLLLSAALLRGVGVLRRVRRARGAAGCPVPCAICASAGGGEPGPRREPGAAPELVAPRPTAPTVSRRGALWLVGGGSLLLFATTAGQNFDGPLRRTALLAPHGGADPGSGPNGFQINKTAASAGSVRRRRVRRPGGWSSRGPPATVRLSRAELLATPLAQLGVAHRLCGGLVDLRPVVAGRTAAGPRRARRATAWTRRPTCWWSPSSGAAPSAGAALRDNQVRDPRSLLALHVNGEPLTPDHGYPARIIVPAAPGVLNTKWVARMTFGDL